MRLQPTIPKPGYFCLLLIYICLLTSTGLKSAPFTTGTDEEIVNRIEQAVESKTKNKSTLNSIVSLLDNPQSSIRVKERAAWALGRLNHRESVHSLVKAAQHKGLLVRGPALDALFHMRARTALPVYISIAQNDPILILRQKATLALGLLQWEKTIDTLVKLSEDPAEEIRGAAALSMGATHSSKNDFTSILKEMNEQDPSPYVQLRALKALRVAQRKNSTIHTHLESEDPDIRLMAAFYLHYHGGSKDLQALKNQTAKETDPEAKYEMDRAILGINRRLAAQKKREEQKKKEKEEAMKKAQENSPPGPAKNTSSK